MASYRLFSSDSHVFEPQDLWQTRIEARFRDRAPYVVHEDDTDQWYADGNIRFGLMGSNSQAGLRFEERERLSMVGRYGDVPVAGYDPHVRVKNMDLDGVAGDVLYPSISLSGWMIPAGDLVSAMFRAYNDWLAEYCKPYPNRLRGLAMLNVDDVAEAVAELQRAANMGLVGAMIPVGPLEPPYYDPVYEPLWAAAQDLEMPLTFHVGTARWWPEAPELTLEVLSDPYELTNSDMRARNAIVWMMFSGVFDRYPKLRVGAIEYEAAWAAYFLDKMDNVYTQRPVHFVRRFKTDAIPSDLFHNSVFISFQEDALAVRLRDHIGIEQLVLGFGLPPRRVHLPPVERDRRPHSGRSAGRREGEGRRRKYRTPLPLRLIYGLADGACKNALIAPARSAAANSAALASPRSSVMVSRLGTSS